MKEEIIEIFCNDLKEKLITVGNLHDLCQIRLRVGREVILSFSNTEYIVEYNVTLKDLLDILINISNNSIYAIQNDINNGFVTIKGGHRIGICGEVVLCDNSIKNIKYINSLSIRVAKQLIGCSNKIMPYIYSSKGVNNTLIISPPGCGKTTILRDCIRQISNGYLNYLPKNVGLVDERGEIAAMHSGIASLDVGKRTDVLSNCPKQIGIELLQRSMSEDIIATDEIGSKKDIDAVKSAALSGVSLLFTIHGSSYDDILKKSDIKDLIDKKIFNTFIVLSKKNGPGTIEDIIKI